ncbi:MAG: DUF4230 domain-containing protein [Planctomycetota bacterium]
MSEKTPERRESRGPFLWVGRHLGPAAVLLALACAVAAVVILLRGGPTHWEEARRATVEVLHSEEMMFLVTDRTVTRLDVVSKEGSLLLGWRESLLIGTVQILSGVDLEKLSVEDVRRQEGRLVVRVPEPEVLQVAVDLDSLSLFEKKSGLIAIKQYLQKEDVRGRLQAELEERAEQFAAEQGLLPGRAAVVGRLNEWAAPLISSRVGVEVEFR